MKNLLTISLLSGPWCLLAVTPRNPASIREKRYCSEFYIELYRNKVDKFGVFAFLYLKINEIQSPVSSFLIE